MNYSSRGFTIVELAITMVIISILATITISAYRGYQARARDSVRADHLVKIKDALELYYAKNGRYPQATATPNNASSWEVSNQDPGTFLEQLYGYGVDEKTIDPINDATHRYYYYRYAAGGGAGACRLDLGGFYVLRATFETEALRPTVNTFTSGSSGECGSPQAAWQAGGTNPKAFTFHAFETNQ